VWNTGETSSAINITSSNQYTLEVTDDKGCSSKDSVNINVLNCNVRLSNVMTPDANGLNDMFFQGGEDLVSFHLVIFNRWGTKIHETTTNEKKWSCNCDAGTYYYTIEAIDIYQQKGTWSGFFTLIK
jgi:gliding motility-associated-like protein